MIVHDSSLLIGAMKFLTQKYREAMSDWFGKAENGMHAIHVLFKEGDRLVKKAYLKGKASQGVGFVMAVY